MALLAPPVSALLMEVTNSVYEQLKDNSAMMRTVHQALQFVGGWTTWACVDSKRAVSVERSKRGTRFLWLTSPAHLGRSTSALCHLYVDSDPPPISYKVWIRYWRPGLEPETETISRPTTLTEWVVLMQRIKNAHTEEYLRHRHGG